MYLQMGGDVTVRKTAWVPDQCSTIIHIPVEFGSFERDGTEMIAETILFVLKALNVLNLKSVLA